MRFELAGEKDDGELRRLLKETAMAGRIALSAGREPSYFGALKAEGFLNQVIVARDEAGAIAAFGTRSLRRVFVNGKPEQTGYLGNLRILPARRRGSVLSRGYDFLRKLHSDGKTAFYLTTIMSDNRQAAGLLSSGRCGLPAYNYWGEYVTSVFCAASAPKPQKTDFEILQATPETLASVSDFLGREGPRRQFFPCAELSGGSLGGLEAENFYAATRGGEIIGVMAKRDQRDSRQLVVSGYGKLTGALRPVYNLWAKAAGYPQLPPPATALNCCYVSFAAVSGDEKKVFSALLSRLASDWAAQGGELVLVGLHSSDPLSAALAGFKAFKIKSGLYVVTFEEHERRLAALRGRTPHLEIATI